MQGLIRPQVMAKKGKMVLVMGATGTGKSRLAIDLATRFQGEIINSDKIQIHQGLDILTNKITEEDSHGVPHHLFNCVDSDADFSAADFCTMATAAIRSILDRGKLPIIAGGSNSFIKALVEDLHSNLPSRYECCFLWVDVSMPVLDSFVSDRVDQMVQRGIVDELAKVYAPNSDYSKGIKRSIGAPEFDHYLHVVNNASSVPDEMTRVRLLEEAINDTKINTCKLARRQRDKINMLKTVEGWKINKIDATQVFKNRDGEADKLEAYEKIVLVPSSMIVSKFLAE